MQRLTLSQFRRCSSLVRVHRSESDGVATLFMNHPPVNSLDLDTLKSLKDRVEALNKDAACRGLILASSLPKAFSAGVELTEFHKPNPERLRAFWSVMLDLWITLYGSRLPTVAAINNHAIAGGCLLAVCCDSRVMSNGTIGLNETKLGLTPPVWLNDRFIELVGIRLGERAVVCGSLFTAQEALQIGLIDRVADKQDLLRTAKSVLLDEYFAVPGFAAANTKAYLRKERVQRFLERREAYLDEFVAVVLAPDTQRVVAAYFDTLKAKKAGK